MGIMSKMQRGKYFFYMSLLANGGQIKNEFDLIFFDALFM